MAKKFSKTASSTSLAATRPAVVKAFNMNSGQDICDRQGSTVYGLDLKAKKTTQLFPSVDCNEAYMAEMAEGAPDFADDIYGWGHCGYMLINGALVPAAFVDKVHRALRDTMLTYGAVVKVEALFPTAFLTSLDQDEKAVLGACVLMLIERGDLSQNFPSPKGFVA